MQQKITPELIKGRFTFLKSDIKIDEEKSIDRFFCSCGSVINKTKGELEEIKVEVNELGDYDLLDIISENKSVNIVCNSCEKDYNKKENYNKIIGVNDEFFECFQFEKENENIYLYKFRFIGNVSEDNSSIIINQKELYIRYNLQEKNIFFKNINEDEQEVSLDKIMSVVKTLLNHGDVKITEGLFDVHLFIDSLAGYVADSKNINIIDELMSLMVGQAGLNILEKTLSIFLGIICYPNLSTVALTKGTVFLYDLMNECVLPNPKEMSDAGATSPLKIFNYLVNVKNEELKKENDSHDSKKVGEYKYISKEGREATFKFKVNALEDISIKRTKDGVVYNEEVENKNVSPFIYNKIKTFNDYKTLIRYTKIITYTELISLVQKHELKFLLNLLDIVEFRADMNFKRLEQIINICMSYVSLRSNERISIVKNRYDNNKTVLIKDEKESLDSSEIKEEKVLNFDMVKFFDLTTYDDSLRMIKNLKWDPNKEFYKIKDFHELIDYHTKLIEFFSQLSNKEQNKMYVEFVSKYNKLETSDELLEVSLIKTPEMLLNEAKTMKNCAGSYVNRISDGQYLLFVVKDLDKNKLPEQHERYMMGISVNKYGLEFDQIKATCNKQGPDRFKLNIMKYLEDHDISYKELADLKLTNSKGTNEDNNGLPNLGNMNQIYNALMK